MLAVLFIKPMFHLFILISYLCLLTASSFTIFSNPDGAAAAWLSPVGQYIEFLLRTCNSLKATVHLVSAARQPDAPGYDISFSNSVSTIVRRKTGNAVSAETPGLLNCIQLSKLWVTWTSNGIVTVGKGRIGANVILELRDTSGDAIAAASVSTTGNVGEWQIASVSG